MVIPDFFLILFLLKSAHTHGTNLFGKQIDSIDEFSGLENGQMQIMHFRGNKWVFYYIPSYPDIHPYKDQL